MRTIRWVPARSDNLELQRLRVVINCNPYRPLPHNCLHSLTCFYLFLFTYSPNRLDENFNVAFKRKLLRTCGKEKQLGRQAPSCSRYKRRHQGNVGGNMRCSTLVGFVRWFNSFVHCFYSFVRSSCNLVFEICKTFSGFIIVFGGNDRKDMDNLVRNLRQISCERVCRILHRVDERSLSVAVRGVEERCCDGTLEWSSHLMLLATPLKTKLHRNVIVTSYWSPVSKI